MWWSSTLMEGSITFRVIRSVGSVPQKWTPDLYRRFPVEHEAPDGQRCVIDLAKGAPRFLIFLSNPMPSDTARRRNPSVCGLLSALTRKVGWRPISAVPACARSASYPGDGLPSEPHIPGTGACPLSLLRRCRAASCGPHRVGDLLGQRLRHWLRLFGGVPFR